LEFIFFLLSSFLPRVQPSTVKILQDIMDLLSLQQNFEDQLVRTAEMLEEKVDQQLKELENMDEDDFERLRQKRLLQLKAAHNQKQV